MKKMDKKDLQFIVIFIVVLACSFTYLYQSSYAKYRKRVTAGIDLKVAKWTIKINNEDVKNKKMLTNKK